MFFAGVEDGTKGMGAEAAAWNSVFRFTVLHLFAALLYKPWDNNSGCCRIQKPRVKEALVLLKQVLEASPEDTDTLIAICELQVQQDTEQAKQALEKLKCAPKENVPMEFWNNVGVALHKLGQPAGLLILLLINFDFCMHRQKHLTHTGRH